MILPAPQVYVVGGGIASMAAAVFMIRDGDVFGQNITILEESDRIGSSLDGAGSPEEGYILRGDNIVDRCCYAWNKLVDQPWKIISIGSRTWAQGV